MSSSSPALPASQSIVIIGAGIVGNSLAYHLTHGRGPLAGGLIHSLGRSPVSVGQYP